MGARRRFDPSYWAGARDQARATLLSIAQERDRSEDAHPDWTPAERYAASEAWCFMIAALERFIRQAEGKLADAGCGPRRLELVVDNTRRERPAVEEDHGPKAS